MTEWTQAMEEEFEMAKEWIELGCEDEINEYRVEREAERDSKIKQVKEDIVNSVIL